MKYNDFSQAPFLIPQFIDNERQVGAYEKIFNLIEIGYGDSNARILIRQKEKKSLQISPPDHFFTLEVDAPDIGQSKWLTLEFVPDLAQFVSASRITILISLASQVQDAFAVAVRFLREDGSFEDLSLGSFKAANDELFRPVNLSQPLGPFLKRFGGAPSQVRLILFAPARSGTRFSLAMFNIFVTAE